MNNGDSLLDYILVTLIIKLGGALRYTYFKLTGKTEVAEACFSESHKLYNLIVGLILFFALAIFLFYKFYIADLLHTT